MNSLLFGIILSALFSATSLVVVLLSVSPLTAPLQAVATFFVSLFLTISTVGALFFIGLWRLLPVHTWDTGKLMSISLRQGIFLGLATVILLLFHILGLLNWWIALLIYAVAVLVELALNTRKLLVLSAARPDEHPFGRAEGPFLNYQFSIYKCSIIPAMPAKPGPGSWAEYKKRIKRVSTLNELQLLEKELFGRKSGKMTLAMKELKELPPKERKKQAKELNEFKQTFIEELEVLKEDLQRPKEKLLGQKDAVDVTLDLPERKRGHLHLIHEFIRQAEEVFGRMGFDVERGPEIETEELNFNLLNIPEDHPARDTQDTFWIKSQKPKAKGQRLVLRTHTSPIQIRYMRSHKPPFRAVFPGKVYRKDADATHSPMFHHLEGLMVGRDITLANMKAVMIVAMRELISKDVQFRFRTGYFPFVEPGLELDVRWQGEDKTKEGDWLEIVGCGMVHPNVLKNCNIDPNKWQGFAFGFGVDRMVMIKHQIPDIRSLFTSDVRFLRQF